MFKIMAQNNAWANATIFEAVNRLYNDATHAPAPGFFPTLATTLDHIYEVDLYYIDALEQGGMGRAVYDRQAEQDMRELARKQADLDTGLIRFCEALTPGTLAQTRSTERGSTTCDEDVSALLLHLFQHQVHHRGQAHVQLHSLGMAPPQLDDFHLRFERAPSAEAYWT